MSADPPLATGEYLPTGDKEQDANLPGMGGMFNSINLDGYQYCGMNPVKFIDPDGNANIVVIVGSANGQGKNFENAANTFKKEHSKGNSISIFRADDYKSKGELLLAVELSTRKEGIDDLVYFGHSLSGTDTRGGKLSVFSGRSDVKDKYIDKNTDLSDLKFNKNSKIYLFGCNGATGKESIAQILADKTGSTVYGFTSYSSFTNDKSLGHFYYKKNRRKGTTADVHKRIKSGNVWMWPNNNKGFKKVKPRN